MTTMRHAPPNAAIMIEALRGLGYNTATALADIIDNSISAGARKVDLTFHWRESRIAISWFGIMVAACRPLNWMLRCGWGSKTR